MTVNQKRLWRSLSAAIPLNYSKKNVKTISLKDFKEIWAAAKAEATLEHWARMSLSTQIEKTKGFGL